MKLLSPAGNFESLKTAVFNGADEVYLGINDFNARNNIDGFTLESLKEAVSFAHLYGVKVLLAINILFTDDEIQKALNIIVEAYNFGVDAFVLQDLGLAAVIFENEPEIELHASTQMGIHNLEGVLAVKKYGFKRVVLARETPLNEIKRIKNNVDIEIEYFVHGALCVSFSGNCYLSSYLLNESGNRGKCKQLCRLPYTLKKGEKFIKKGYLLSAKDFSMLNRLKDLEAAGVDVLKIEGRARRPYYVGEVTKTYRAALDGKSYNSENLALAFNRGFTEGYFNGNGNIISNLNNHTGIFIGEVIKINNGKKFNEIFFTSKRELSPKSAFKFFDGETEKATVSAFDLKKENGVYRITTTQRASVGNSVHLIVDNFEEERLVNYSRKIPFEISLFAEVNKPIKASFTVKNKSFEVFGEMLVCAENKPLTEEEIFENFEKSAELKLKVNIKSLEKVFILKKNLNAFRREVVEKLKSALTEVERNLLSPVTLKKPENTVSFSDFCFTEDYKKSNSLNVIYSPEIYDEKDVAAFVKWANDNGKNAYLDLPNFALEKDILLLKQIIESTGVKIVANNYYALNFNAEKIIGGGLNVYNSYTASELNLPVISAEGNLFLRADFAYMTLRHCPFKNHAGADCSSCPYEKGYTLTGDDGKIMKIKRKKLTSCTFYLTK